MNFGQNLYNWFLSNAQSLVLLAIVVIGLYLGFKREFSKLIGFLIIAIIAVGLVFNAAGVKDILLELSALLTHFSSIEELSEHQEDIIIHSDCDDMYDVARYYIEETGALGEVPASLQNYIDYQAYGRDLDLSGTFISTNHGIFEIVY
ncbi:Antirestriction protein [Streptococcus suis]|nr:antirestriction protein ArdA [Streptococcus suis]CZB10050.1 Antirestriction protein [Streptococcus suis]